MNSNEKNLVLILEDRTDLRMLYGDVLTSAGFQIDLAPDGEIGMEKIANTDWSVLLLDIMLPIKDGMAILKEVREKNLKKGSIIMLTSLDNEEIIKQCMALGADGYITKTSITPSQIVDEVKAAIAGTNANRTSE